MRTRLTFANVTAALALFFALSAGSYAAIALPANSVTTKQVKNHSLLKADFKPGQLPRGAQGPAGPAGSPGVLDVKIVNGDKKTIPATSSAAVPNAQCPTGYRVLGTGFSAEPGGRWTLVQAYDDYVGGFYSNDSKSTITANVQAICAQIPSASASAAGVGRPAQR
jgi:hypothetical protein